MVREMLDVDMNSDRNTEQNKYNQVKKKILNIINTMGEATSWQISLITGQSVEAASMALLRYHKMGLLHRRTLRGRLKIYSITQRGRERLAWLIENHWNE